MWTLWKIGKGLIIDELQIQVVDAYCLQFSTMLHAFCAENCVPDCDARVNKILEQLGISEIEGFMYLKERIDFNFVRYGVIQTGNENENTAEIVYRGEVEDLIFYFSYSSIGAAKSDHFARLLFERNSKKKIVSIDHFVNMVINREQTKNA